METTDLSILRDAWQLPDAAAPAPGPGAGDLARPFTDASVMMIDDEPILLELVRSFLEQAGYRDFRGESDPELGVRRVAAERPDVLLLDLKMDGMSGFEVLRRVRRDPQAAMMPVIVMTSASDSRTKLRVLELGATDFLEKPVDPSELVLRLRNTLAFKAVRDRSNWFDLLTGLPNRRLLISKAGAAIRRCAADGTVCALLHIELQRMRQVIQAFGQRAAEDGLRVLAQRLQGALLLDAASGRFENDASGVVFARSGPEEFAALLIGLQRVEDAEPLARRLLATLAAPVPIEGHDCYPLVSIGIAGTPQDAVEAEPLLRCANAAAAAVRTAAGCGFGYYSPAQNAAALHRLTMEAELRRAIEREQFELHYQPKIDMRTGATIGCEALLRWRHPERGMVSPGEFIPIAEEAGLIVDIGTWVLFEACRAARRWADAGRATRVSVNVATPHFRDGRLLRDVRAALEATRLPESLLLVELTESMLMGQADDGLRNLHQLKALGISISLDDFGTGFSSLAYLSRMPLDELKIDRSFISGLPDDAENFAIVRAIVALGSSLGLSLIAEGVETEQQSRALQSIGCVNAQGWLYSRALPEIAFVERLAAGGPVSAPADPGPPVPARD